MEIKKFQNFKFLFFSDITVEQQLHACFFKFYHGLNTSDNKYLGLCSKLVMSGSRSSLANSLNYLCHRYNVNKFHLNDMCIDDIVKSVKTQCMPCQESLVSAGTIRDFLELRNYPLTARHDRANFNVIIENLCLS